MLNPFIELISQVINIFTLILFIWVVMSLLIQFEIINKYNKIVSKVYDGLSQVLEPILRPFRKLQRKLFPRLYAIDLSPIFLLLALHFINSALYHWFYQI